MAQVMSLSSKPVVGLTPLRSRKALKCCAQAVETKRQAQNRTEEIYIGFQKGDYAPRAGRKGRVIRDDPAKYPEKQNIGPFLGAVGGWAGGEVGLWQIREEAEAELAKQQKNGSGQMPLAPSSPVRQPQKNKWNVRTTSPVGKDEIYVGFGKDELELRKSGVPGRIIYDEAWRYPNKEDIAGLRGLVGGFAGGEAALRQFAETGELKLRKPGDPTVKKQFSPLTLAFLIIFAAAGGGALLTGAIDFGEVELQEVLKAPVDDTTKNLLLASIALIAAAGTIASVRAAIQWVQDQVPVWAETGKKVAVTSAFLGVVFLAAKAILESP